MNAECVADARPVTCFPAVRPLDYRSSEPSPVAAPMPMSVAIATISLSLGSFVGLLFVFLHNVIEEPFGGFSTKDAAIQVGLPAVVAAAWVAWFIFVLAKGRLPWMVPVALAGWGAVNVAACGFFIVAYFQEPWCSGW